MISIKSLVRATAGASLVAGVSLLSVPAIAAGPKESCPVAASERPVKKKSLGLGGLIGAARGSSLFGSVMGAAGGDGNLEQAARSAATETAGKVVACAEATARQLPAHSGNVQPDAASEAAPDRPVRAATATSVSYPSQLPEPDGFEAIKRAYDDFGKVHCKECEGGFAFDGWPVYPRDEFAGKYGGDEQRIGSWSVGHIHHWKGTESAGSVTVLAEQSVGGFRCRTLRYRLTKSTSSAERPGLLCWGRANQFAGKESWNEVY